MQEVTVQKGKYGGKNPKKSQRDAERAKEAKATRDRVKTAMQLIGKKTPAAGRKPPTPRKRAGAPDSSDEEEEPPLDSSDED